MRKNTKAVLSISEFRFTGSKQTGQCLAVVMFVGLQMLYSAALAQDSSWQRSYSLEAVGQYANAAKIIEKYLSDDASSEYAQLRSAWLYYLDANYSRSIKHYQTALKLNKQSLEARLGMTLPLLAQQRWREAAVYSREVINESKWNYYAHIRLMMCEEGMQLWDVLIEHAGTLSKRYPADPSILVYLARAYHHKGDRDKAREIYLQVLMRLPQHVEATNYVYGQG